MKKFIIIAAAVAATVACAKVEDNFSAPKKEVTFQVANRLTKAAGVLYDNGAFGTYAWYTANAASVTAGTGSDHTPFMVNETINLIGGVWKPSVNTFYWPKTGSIDFISYSPFAGTCSSAGTVPVITQNSINYNAYTAADVDLMYADKATGYSSNVNEITDDASPESGYEGVPTLFHHALAKLSFNIVANFVEYTDPLDASKKTTWDVTVTSAKISGFKTTGSCALTLNADNKTWALPVTTENSVDYNVWTSLSGASAEQELVDATTYPTGVLLTTTAQDLNPATGYVIPQILAANTQKLELTIHIKTHLPNGLTIDEDYNPTIDIKDISSLKAWEINDNITYTIKIKPVAYVNTYDNPEDVIITFDPAVADWKYVTTVANIQL